MAIARLNYKPNRTQKRTRKSSTTGKRRATRPEGILTRYAARTVWYCTYGHAVTPDDRQVALRTQRAVWYGPDGQPCSYDEVCQWTKQNTRAHKYVYHILLSTGPERKIPIRPSDWVEIMRPDEHFREWRLVQHDDTNNTHAHVIAWSDKVLSRTEHARWHGPAQERLAARERERVRERALTREREHAREREPELTL